MEDLYRRDEIRDYKISMVYSILYGYFSEWLEANWDYLKYAEFHFEPDFDKTMEVYLDRNRMEYWKEKYLQEKEAQERAAKASI